MLTKLKLFHGFKSPYFVLFLCFIVSSPLFFLRGIGVFDDSVFLEIGELILKGYLPYRDIFDNKPPGIYYLGALIAWVGNNHWLAPRIFLFIFSFIFGILLIIYTARIWSKLAAYFVAWLFGLSYIICQGYSFHTDQFSAFWGFIALVQLTKKPNNNKLDYWLAGVFIGLSFLFKQTAVLYLLAIIISLIFRRYNKRLFQKKLQFCLFLIFGFTTITALLFLVVLILGIWPDFYDAIFKSLPLNSPINLYATIKLWLKAPAISFLPLSLVLLIIFPIFRNYFFKSIGQSDSFYLITVTAFLSLFTNLKTYSNTHYLGISIVSASLINAIILSEFFKWSAATNFKIFLRKKIRALISIIVYCVFAIYLFAIVSGSSIILSQNRIAIDLNQKNEIQNIINLYTDSQVPILCLSDNPARFYYMLDRKPLTRYIYYYGAGWLNEQMLNLSDAYELLKQSQAKVAILEFPFSISNTAQNKPKLIMKNNFELKISNKYKIINPVHSYHPIYNTQVIVLIKK